MRNDNDDNRKKYYGSVDAADDVGVEYSIPIQEKDESKSGSFMTNSSTVESDESTDSLRLWWRQEKCRSTVSSSCSDWFFWIMGFQSNPFFDEKAADLRLSMLSNFSAAYNVVSISLALKLMTSSSSIADSISIKQESICTAAFLLGMMVGQVTLGTLGDIFGRRRAMAIGLWLQVGAALGSALVPNIQTLTFFRFILGLGCGGYPLSATLTTESSLFADNNNNNTDTTTSNHDLDMPKLVALIFAFQGVGYLAAPLTAWLLVSLLGEEFIDSIWRVLLGLGALPGVLLTISRWRQRVNSDGGDNNASRPSLRVQSSSSDYVDLVKHLAPQPRVRTVPTSVWEAIRLEPDLLRKLLGTAGSWFLLDVIFYGNTLFQSVVFSAGFGANETVLSTCQDALIIAFMALPGYFVTVAAVGRRQSPRTIQLQGFLAMSILYLVIGMRFDVLSEQNRAALLVLYGSAFFFSNYGPNATTFMLPSMTFAKECRSTLNGICAACGKAGAMLGATVFALSCDRFGEDFVFLCCAALSFVGCLLTMFCVAKRLGEDSHLTSTEREELEQLRAALPVKIVYSNPSLIDV